MTNEYLHPESDAPEATLPQPEWASALSNIQIEIDQAKINREGWRNKLTTQHKLRYGIRGTKTFPWPGCSNLHLPLIEKVIRRIKPNVVALVANVRPTAIFKYEKPSDMSAAQRAELYFDFMLWNRVPNFLKTVVQGADQMLEKGAVVFKQFYHYETRDVVETFRLDDLTEEERSVLENGIPDEVQPLDPMTGTPAMRPMTHEEMQGFFAAKGGFKLDDEDDVEIVNKIIDGFEKDEKSVTFKRQEEVVNSPDVVAVDLENIIVPDDATICVNDLRWIVHRMWMTKMDLKRRERDGLYENVDQIQEMQTQKTSANEAEIIEVKEDREGVTASSSDDGLIEIYELFCHIDLNGDGVEERCVVTYQPDTNVVLRKVRLPYDHGKWPFVYIPLEITDGRWYSSRGVPEHLGDLQINITVQHNAKLDRMTIQNAPTFLERIGSVQNGSNIRWVPGQRIKLLNTGDFAPLQIPVLDSSFQIEENATRQWAEELMGITDFGLSNPLATSEARTATEIDQLSKIMQSTFSLDAQIWQDGMREIYEQLWALDNQYGPNEAWVEVQGAMAPISISRHEMQGKLRITPAGNTGNSNRQVEYQKAVMRLQMYAQNPFVNMYELTKDVLEKDDYRLSQRILKTPEQIQAEQAQAQKAEEGPVTLEEAAQMAKQLQKQKPRLQVAL